MGKIRIALCQLNPTVGALAENADKVIEFMRRAEVAGADLAVFPELVIPGYPPEDLLLRPAFLESVAKETARVVTESGSCVSVFGSCDQQRHNIAVLCQQGKQIGECQKTELPNYAVFDEKRYFRTGTIRKYTYVIADVVVGVLICEDVFIGPTLVDDLVRDGAELIVVLNASPFYSTRQSERIELMKKRANAFGIAVVYVNLVGGQDELVFEGSSFVVDGDAELVAQAGKFVEELLLIDLEVTSRERQKHPCTIPVSELSRAVEDSRLEPSVASDQGGLAAIYGALVLGIADYVRKNGFSDIVLGLSGGVDSALVATIAADALGSHAVHAVAMPSQYSSQCSFDDAQILAQNLGISLQVIPIVDTHEAFRRVMTHTIGDFNGLADENLQSRMRGVTLMALSNRFGWLVLTTGNKSEIAVGYSTLYGDSAGGFAVIKDVTKTRVYELCRWRNAQAELMGTVAPIPESILSKAPTAELRPNQRDDQTLPPYDVLDPIIELYVEQGMPLADITKRLEGIDSLPHDELDLTVRTVARLIDRAEYKRRQSPIGVRVTERAFGRDYRMPMTNCFSE